MPKETFVKVIYQDLSEVKDGKFDYKVNLPMDVKECIVKQITYNYKNFLPDAVNNWFPSSYLIYSSLVNDYIGSFCIDEYGQSFVESPNTIFSLQPPKGDRISFSIEEGYNNVPRGYEKITAAEIADLNFKPRMGTLTITLEFHK